MKDALIGRAAIVSGASQGLGFAIADALVAAGADVMLCARDTVQLEHARERLSAKARVDQRVLALPLDIGCLEQVQDFVENTLRALPHLNVLINNAGVYGPMGRIDAVSAEAWRDAVQINLLGSVYLSAAVAPHFRAQRYGKIIQLSGGGATAPLPYLSAYAASKAAVVRFAETLALELREDGVDVNSIAPGALNTRLLDEVLAAGPDKVGADFYTRAVAQKREGGAPLSRAAALAVFLASEASDGISGKLLSAIWDPWEQLPGYRGELNSSDVYTLRRILPRERGFPWGERDDH